MHSVAEAFAAAIDHHQAGRLPEAEQSYRHVLRADPNCADAWNLLGVLASQVAQYQHAVTLIKRAIELRPQSAEFHYNLAFALHGQGQFDDAEVSYRQSLALDLNHVNALSNLGVLLHEQGKLAEAEVLHRRVCALNPSSAEAHFNFGNDLRVQENWSEAIGCYEQAIRLNPAWGEAHSNLGDALQGRGDLPAAATAYRKALDFLPQSAQVHCNLGSALQKLEDWEQSIACFRRAIELAPDFVEARLNMGSALYHQGDFQGAKENFQYVLRRDTNNHHALNWLGLLLRDEGNIDEARQCLDRSIELKPDFAEAHTNRAMLRLADGDFERGWSEYEWRWKTKDMVQRRFDRPQWDGRPLHRQTILLHTEQGLGDTLQFIRYARRVRDCGATVIVESPRSLTHLLASCAGIDRLINAGEKPPPFDFHAPLMSVPGLLKTTLSTIPASVPYLVADAKLVAHWRDKLNHLQGIRIGINWRGRAGQGVFRRRDIPPECFANLAAPNVDLVCLQQGAMPQELEAIGRPIYYPGDDVDRTHGAFTDTAAIMMNLDLVITSDTSTPHLAGALGVPVWIALPYVASWQWMRGRGDSPWYPTARLFRQETPGDWTGVFEVIREELAEFLRSLRSSE